MFTYSLLENALEKSLGKQKKTTKDQRKKQTKAIEEHWKTN